MKYMISACLMGENCKYNGGNNECKELLLYMKDKDVVCVCPEELGGLQTPRACCEIVNDKVMSETQIDVSKQFLKGAQEAVKQAIAQGVDCVITQPRSPSCGVGKIYDGTFQGRLVNGNGWFVRELIKHQIMVVDYESFHENTIKKQEK